jgi:hypothetical protein
MPTDSDTGSTAHPIDMLNPKPSPGIVRESWDLAYSSGQYFVLLSVNGSGPLWIPTGKSMLPAGTFYSDPAVKNALAEGLRTFAEWAGIQAAKYTTLQTSSNSLATRAAG